MNSNKLSRHCSGTVCSKRLADINIGHYGVGNISCEPARNDITSAMSGGNLEKRRFQEDICDLNQEWNATAHNENEYYLLQKQYHARRNAFFTINRWSDPVILHENGRDVKDGLHRLKAALYLGMEFVDVKVCLEEGLA